MATVPSTGAFTAGQVVTAPQLNLPIDFMLGGAAGKRPRFVATMATAVSIPTGVETIIKLDTIPIDDDSGWNLNTGTYTVSTQGMWMISATMQWATNSTGNREILISSNGAISQGRAWVSAATDGFGRGCVSLLTPLSTGNTINLYGFQSSGAALNTGAGNGVVSISGIWLSN